MYCYLRCNKKQFEMIFLCWGCFFAACVVMCNGVKAIAISLDLEMRFAVPMFNWMFCWTGRLSSSAYNSLISHAMFLYVDFMYESSRRYYLKPKCFYRWPVIPTVLDIVWGYPKNNSDLINIWNQIKIYLRALYTLKIWILDCRGIFFFNRYKRWLGNQCV